MWKIATLIHMLLATVLAGIAVIVITVTPALMDNGMKLILPAVIAAALLAVPPSIWVARQILAQSKGS